MPPGLPLHLLAMAGATGLWVGLCLELDFAVQARSQEELPDAFLRAYDHHLMVARERGVEPWKNARPAPLEYWRRYERGEFWLELALPSDGSRQVFARRAAA